MRRSAGLAVLPSVFAGLLVVSLSVMVQAPAGAQPEVPVFTAPDAALPIELDAEFSEFDRRNNTLTFRQLRIVQGALSITAAEATADPADFTDSVWTFTGNVVVQDAATRIDCERAELTFVGNALRRAVLRGGPAKFQQTRKDDASPTRGRADVVEYDFPAGTIRLTGNAWLSDGSNEISGTAISYDLRREIVTADAGESGQVRMKIIPPPPESPGPASQDTPGTPADERRP